MKYELTDVSTTYRANIRTTTYRIRALRDIPRHGVKAGDLGGWISSKSNLSQYDDAWVGGDAVVLQDALVANNASVCDKAFIATYAVVCSSTTVGGAIKVYGCAHIYGHAHITGRCVSYYDLREYSIDLSESP